MTDNAPDFYVSPGFVPSESTVLERDLLPDGTPAAPRGDVVAVEAAAQVGVVLAVERDVWVDRGGLSVGLVLWACAALPWQPSGTWAEKQHRILQPQLHRIATLRVAETAEQWSRCEVIDGRSPEMRAPVYIVEGVN